MWYFWLWLRFVIACNGLRRSWWCHSRIVWTLLLSLLYNPFSATSRIAEANRKKNVQCEWAISIKPPRLSANMNCPLLGPCGNSKCVSLGIYSITFLYLLPNAIEQMILDIDLVMSSCGSKAVFRFWRNISTSNLASSCILSSMECFPRPKSLIKCKANFLVFFQVVGLNIIPALWIAKKKA